MPDRERAGGAMRSRHLTHFGVLEADSETLAVILAGHNIISKYAFKFSADRIRPAALSGVHPRHGSPHRASVAARVGALLVNIPVVLKGVDPALKRSRPDVYTKIGRQ